MTSCVCVRVCVREAMQSRKDITRCQLCQCLLLPRNPIGFQLLIKIEAQLKLRQLWQRQQQWQLLPAAIDHTQNGAQITLAHTHALSSHTHTRKVNSILRDKKERRKTQLKPYGNSCNFAREHAPPPTTPPSVGLPYHFQLT